MYKADVTPTVDDLRDEIRIAVGRHERIESTAFTKEALAAICTAVGQDIDDRGRLPRKSEMRAMIRQQLDGLDDNGNRPFRKAELETILAALSEQ